MKKTKRCCQCGQKKALPDFSKCRSHADGLASICKQCAAVYRKAWAQRNVERLREVKRHDYELNRERYNELARKRRKAHPDARKNETVQRTKRHGKELVEYCRAYRKQNPEKYHAHQTVYTALRNGTLTKPEVCEQCGSIHSLRAHHDNYDEPLNVRWLCESCHKAVHQKEVSHEAVI